MWRGRGAPGALELLGSAGPCLLSPFALLGQWETPRVLWHTQGAGAAVSASVPVVRQPAPSCHFVTVAVVALGVGGGAARGLRHHPDGCPLARWLLGELPPKTPPSHFRIRPSGDSHPWTPRVQGSRSCRSPEKVKVPVTSPCDSPLPLSVFHGCSLCTRHVVKGGLESEEIALVFAPSAEMIEGGGETGGAQARQSGVPH